MVGWRACYSDGDEMVRGLVVTVALVAGLGCASIAPEHPIHGVYIGTVAADNISTGIALDEPGVSEANPFLGDDPSHLRLLALSAAAWVVLRSLENRIEDQIGRELRWYERLSLWLLPTLGHAYATVSNIRLMGRG